MAPRLPALCALLLFAVMGLDADASRPSGAQVVRSFAVVSDIHFDPFSVPALAQSLVASEPDAWLAVFNSTGEQALSRRGEDTNTALLASALAALSRTARNSDFLIMPGDLLAHRFEERAGQALGTPPGSQAVRELTTMTIRYVALSLQAALPGRPIVVALGNNDSDCGDYQIEPQGAFLASTLAIVRQLAGPDLVAPDFDQTYLAAGYYRMRHPTLPRTTILVLNDVLWSTEYRNACGDNSLAAAEEMMSWLERQLAEAHADGRRVWLVHHIPVGVDTYTSLRHSGAATCPVQITLFLNERFGSRFAALLRTSADVIQASFSGHTHRDSYRVILDGDKAVGIDKIVPAISPVFGNNPGFQIFDYDGQTGDPTNFATWHLANLEKVSSHIAAEWRQEYIFSQAYGESAYSAASVDRIAQSMSRPNAANENMPGTFRRFYAGERAEPDTDTPSAELCAINNLDSSSFNDCFCGK